MMTPRSKLWFLSFLVALFFSGLAPRPLQAGDGVWTPIGPYGGSVTSIAFHPSQPDVLWVGTGSNGVFRSTDRGSTWAPMSEGLPVPGVGFLGVSAAAPSTLYATWGFDFFRSIDGGPWERRGTHVSPIYTLGAAIAVDPGRADVLWAGSYTSTSGGIDRSDDGGLTWTEVYPLVGGSSGAAPTGFVFAPNDPSTIYAGLSSSDGAPRGVMRSRDGGATWEIIGSSLVPEGWVSVYLAIAPDTGVLFAGVESDGSSGGLIYAVYRSADGGDTWTLVLPNGFPVTAGPGGLVLSPSGQRSLDGGLSWSSWAPFVTSARLLGAHPSFPGTVFASISNAGLYRSTDSGTSWQEANEGILATWALDLVADPISPETLYASTIGGGLFKTTEGGVVWEHVLPFVFLDEMAAAPSGGETALYGIQLDGGIFRSEDSGASWTNLGNPGFSGLKALAVDSKAPRTVYLSSDRYPQCPTRKSTDGGETWSCLGLGKTSDLAVNPKRPANVWAASKIVYRSTDRGRSWSAAGRGLRNVDVQVLALAPSAQDVAYAGTRKGVYRTTDGGRSWSPANQGLPPINADGPPFTSVTALAVHPRNPLLVYAGVQAPAPVGTAEAGVYGSTDGGRLWKKLPVLPADFSGVLVIDPHDPRTVYAGTFQRGFYAITLRR